MLYFHHAEKHTLERFACEQVYSVFRGLGL
jgi:hypothetical protein